MLKYWWDSAVDYKNFDKWEKIVVVMMETKGLERMQKSWKSQRSWEHETKVKRRRNGNVETYDVRNKAPRGDSKQSA